MFGGVEILLRICEHRKVYTNSSQDLLRPIVSKGRLEIFALVTKPREKKD